MSSESNIRRLLKAFGIQADEAVRAYLEQHPEVETLQIRLILEDVTDYGSDKPAQTLSVEVQGAIGS